MADVLRAISLGMKFCINFYMLVLLKMCHMTSINLDVEMTAGTENEQNVKSTRHTQYPKERKQVETSTAPSVEHGKYRKTTTSEKQNYKVRHRLNTTTRPTVYVDLTARENQVKYLIQFGYLDTCEIMSLCEEVTISDVPALVAMVNDSLFSEGIRRLQTVWGLDVTGFPDYYTRKLMLKARCGNPDNNLIEKHFPNLPNRVKRYKIFRKWPDIQARNLTWKVGITLEDVYYGLPADGVLTMDQVRPVLNRAIQHWTEVTEKLHIEEFRGEITRAYAPDMYVYWGRLEHGDPYPFDGPGKVLAHCFYPTVGDLHYDDDETYVLGCCQGKRDVMQITIHELGHGVGLDHSDKRSAIMFAYYDDRRQNPILGLDDIEGVQAMYGKVTKTLPSVASTTPLPDLQKEDFCRSPNTGVNGAFATDDGRIFFIRDNMFVEVNEGGILDSYPKHLSQVFDRISPDDIIDATLYLPALYRERRCADTKKCYIIADGGGLYVFVQTQFYFYQYEKREFHLTAVNYLTTRFENVPSLISGASATGTSIMIVRAGMLYQYNRYYKTRGRYKLDSGFPKEISEVFTDISGQVIGGGMVVYTSTSSASKIRNFHFLGPSYRRYTPPKTKADQRATFPYPRSINSWWFECEDSESEYHKNKLELTGFTLQALPDLLIDINGKIKYTKKDIKSVAIESHAANMKQVRTTLLLLCVLVALGNPFYSQ